MMISAPALPSAPTLPSTRPRVPMWDNARFIAVTLVVMGHSIQPLTDVSDAALVIYLAIYSFHMPAFAVISGYFSQAGPPSSVQMKKVLTDILVPYIIMESIWGIIRFLVEGDQTFDPSTPSWTLWFLLALGIFRVVLPYLALVRWPLAWALVLSIGVGYLSNVDSTFSLARAIGVLPFFVLGWQLREWDLITRLTAAQRATWWLRGAALGVVALWVTILSVSISTLRGISAQHWFFFDDSYSAMDADPWWAGLVRFGVILIATTMSAAFLVLIPRSPMRITALGRSTMYVYLLHSFALYPLRESGILAEYALSPLLLPVMLLVALLISLALSAPLVRKIFWPLIEPRPQWIFVDRHEHRA
ncbi:MAG: acyltransferase family protein [Rhodoglobus sp.]